MWLGIGVIVLMGFFPPLTETLHGATSFKGYGFLLFRHDIYIHIYFARLAMQWILVAVVIGGLIVTFKDKKTEN
jgi:hypothetical protein